MNKLKIAFKNNLDLIIEILAFGLLVFILYLLFLNNSYGMSYFDNGDMQRGFQRGIDVLNGVNSYRAFNLGNMLTQEKVPGFFPLYFVFMAVLARFSNYSFPVFVDVLRHVIFLSFVGLSSTLYIKIRKSNKALAFLLVAVFMFNRWTLKDLFDLKQEAYVLFLSIFSLTQLEKRPKTSIFLYGISTAIKHLTIFLLPIYLLHFLKSKNCKQTALAFLLFLSPLVLPSIPYFIDSPSHMMGSIFFNVTREPEALITNETNTQSTGFDKMLILYNQDRKNSLLYSLPRIPMLLLLSGCLYLLVINRIDKWKYGFCVYLIFVAFNPTLFTQYLVWMMCFVPLALTESPAPASEPEQNTKQ